MATKSTQERVKAMLRDTITLLCKNSLEFRKTFTIEALIGVTLDDDNVLLMSINEEVKVEKPRTSSDSESQSESVDSRSQGRRKRARKKRHEMSDDVSDDSDGDVDQAYPITLTKKIKSDIADSDTGMVQEPDNTIIIKCETNEDEQDEILSSEQWQFYDTGQSELDPSCSNDPPYFINKPDLETEQNSSESMSASTSKQHHSQAFPQSDMSENVPVNSDFNERTSTKTGQTPWNTSVSSGPPYYFKCRKLWKPEDMDKAIQAVMRKEANATQASQHYNVPISTLRWRLKKLQN